MNFRTLMIVIMCFLLTACISRLSRPEIRGVIVDESQHPLIGVKVGETFTNAHGEFKLPEQRYWAFVLKEFMYREAPPVYVQENVIKAGYMPCQLKYYSKFGGGIAKGAQHLIGTVQLIPVFKQIRAETAPNWVECQIENK